ncbi:MAG TPA: metallophosphoesterase family protein [Candidatus Limnocylindrales bacterium]|nr:metallophosphoesterase family protein [Candidatus Limnocylindrales bacterium]
MRICVLSDVHSNLPALEAILAAMAPYDALWHLGDIVGYGPQPNEVVARLAAEGALGVRGNHDAAAIGQLPTDAFNDEARAAVEWTADQLSDISRAWLTDLPERREIADFTLVHGSPRDPTWEYVFTGRTARGSMAQVTSTHCLVGHTHVPMAYLIEDSTVEAHSPDGAALELAARRALLNPGSVGQPRDGDKRASGMVIDTDNHTVEWRRAEYDIGNVQELMREAGLPRRLVQRLELGL